MKTRLLARPWVLGARLRQALVWRRVAPREQHVLRYAPGRSFADIGAMWRVHGQIAFLAEASGATTVTAADIMEPTAQYEAEHRRRESKVRFVKGDLHRAEVLGAIGPHQVVWCSGLLYHSPNPLLALERLHEITGEVLILATETIPEVPGLAQACVFFPGLAAADRRLHALARPGATALGLDSEVRAEDSYGAWWWGISRTALRAMLGAAGFRVLEEHGGPLQVTLIASPA